jgi:hypothetical protein
MYMMMADVNEQFTGSKRTGLKAATSSQPLVDVTQNEPGVSNNPSESAEISTNVDQQRHSSVSNDEDDGGFKGNSSINIKSEITINGLNDVILV